MVSGEFDFLLTCPPYADLEVYSDDERDISNMNYTDFIKTLGDIVRKSTAMLKENAYAAIVSVRYATKKRATIGISSATPSERLKVQE